MLVLVSTILIGCSSNQAVKDKLQSGYAQLDSHQYGPAMATANDALQMPNQGASTATALYLRGRAYEDRPKSSPFLAASDLQAARADYVNALAAGPDRGLEGRLHASLGNVAFDQDDYGTAERELSAAAGELENPQDRALALFKLAKAQQRLGRWDEADKSLTAVGEQLPASPLAQSARQIHGQRAFFVRVATFRSASSADAAATALAKNGVTVKRLSDPANPSLQILRAGPFPRYVQALQVKQQLALVYADAMIEP